MYTVYGAIWQKLEVKDALADTSCKNLQKRPPFQNQQF